MTTTTKHCLYFFSTDRKSFTTIELSEPFDWLGIPALIRRLLGN